MSLGFHANGTCTAKLQHNIKLHNREIITILISTKIEPWLRLDLLKLINPTRALVRFQKFESSASVLDM